VRVRACVRAFVYMQMSLCMDMNMYYGCTGMYVCAVLGRVRVRSSQVKSGQATVY
jgi:hypothetical protein